MMVKVFDDDGDLIYSYETEWQSLLPECTFPARERIPTVDAALAEARTFLTGEPVLQAPDA